MYMTIKVQDRDHVLTDNFRPEVITYFGGRIEIPQANYKGTGMALCGILRRGETLEQWRQRKQSQ